MEWWETFKEWFLSLGENYGVNPFIFDGQPSDKFNALKYDDYQEHQGLLLPHKLTGYAYEDGQIGDIRYVNHFDQIDLNKEKPDQQLFAMPEQAEAVQ